MKTAIITGITGQDGSYLAELLLQKEYTVYGWIRRSSSPISNRIQSILTHPNLTLVSVDLSDMSSILQALRPHIHRDAIEIYNLAAQSHVHVSFSQPAYSYSVNALGVLHILDAIRALDMTQKVRFYQASTSELFGKVQETPQTETTPFYPRSPYGVSKLYAFWIVKNYRESYGMFACNGILFNHESERRGEEFVTRKITKGIATLKNDPTYCLVLGNLDAQRDWGYAPDYVEGMWRMLQHTTPDDYVLATGKTHSIREFVEVAWKHPIRWSGSGVDETGTDIESGRTIVRIHPDFYRPAEVELLIGNATKAMRILGWTPTTSFHELVQKMVENDS